MRKRTLAKQGLYVQSSEWEQAPKIFLETRNCSTRDDVRGSLLTDLGGRIVALAHLRKYT